jgi:hypothetical protein
MTLRNRVLPDGNIEAIPMRCDFMGNRGGRIHNPATRMLLPRRRWASKRWICCLTAFQGRHRTVMGNSYTELFFLDEVTALAAGHRPCFECRRADAVAFAEAWRRAVGAPTPPSADEMDAVLHAERLAAPVRADAPGLPAGAMARLDDAGFIARSEGCMKPWTPDGYRGAIPAAGSVRVLTPPAILKVLAAGYRPAWHASAASG